MLSLRRSRIRSCQQGTRIGAATTAGQVVIQRQGGTDVELTLGGHDWESDITDVAPSLRTIDVPEDFPGCPDCGTEQLQWVFIRTAPETWEEKRGHAGWVLRCSAHHSQLAYVAEIAG